MSVAIGRGVDDDLHAFGDRGGASSPPVLCAKIDTGRRREAALFERGEFCGVIGREKDVVMREGESRGLDAPQKGDGGQRTVFGRKHGNGFADTGTEFSCRQRRWVGIHDDAVGAQLFPGGKRDTALLNAGDGCVVAEARAVPCAERLERAGKCRQPAIDQPDALSFDVRDQHQCG
jgi:hypothetical protein